MKLHGLETFIVAPPPPGYGGRYWLIVRLVTEDGYGECYVASVGPRAMEATIEDVFVHHMHGEDPHNIERMSRRAYSSGFTQRPDLTVIGALSRQEIACWDILGKAHDRPIQALLGGVMNEAIRSYSYRYPLPHHDPDEFCVSPEMAAEAAAAMIEQGFTAVKFGPAGPYTIRSGHMPAMSDISRSLDYCRAAREVAGDRADLLFWTHAQFSSAGAIRLAKALEPLDALWFEVPVPPNE